MFKLIQNHPKKLLTLIFGVTFPFLFQNCSPNSFINGETEQSSTAQTPVYMGTTNPTQLIDDHPDVVTTQKVIEIDADLLLADRRYARRILEDFFGPSTFARNVNASADGLIENATDFADVCSIYRQYRVINSTNNTFAMGVGGENCNLRSGADGIGADVYSKPSVTRAGWVEQNCLNLVENQTTLQYALAKIDSSKANPDLNQTNMLKVFNAFYRDKPAPATSMIDSLLILADPSVTTVERWKAPIYSVCTSGYWQVL